MESQRQYTILKPLHLQQCYENLGYKIGDFPISEKAAKKFFFTYESFLHLKRELKKFHYSFNIWNL